ncbi:uncharacterized protein LOC111605885 isoform X1 [Xiphophorus maculatus]|uniref:uncharacterized protein LOC111605885 isoform X1 n=1 Tax=Xiphophorus maculatus TaxID=8083 RepID=UPI000C6D9B36|nr:uncharacterized protein LOC111605885 isoform X1 [Xiphophorus maculatus]
MEEHLKSFAHGPECRENGVLCHLPAHENTKQPERLGSEPNRSKSSSRTQTGPAPKQNRSISSSWFILKLIQESKVVCPAAESGSKLGHQWLQLKKGEKLWTEPEPPACNDTPCVQQTDATAPQQQVLVLIGPILDVTGGTLCPAAGGEVRLIRSGPDVERLSPRDPSSGTSCPSREAADAESASSSADSDRGQRSSDEHVNASAIFVEV